MLYPPYPAESAARSALPNAAVVPDQAPRRRLHLPVVRPMRWRLVTRRPTFGRLTGARI